MNLRRLQLVSMLVLIVALSACGTNQFTESTEMSEEYSAENQVLYELFGTKLIDVEESVISPAELEGKIIGVFFSAEWCPPCRSFSPVLVDVYNELQATDKPFEVVFVSADNSAREQMSYMQDYNMPWKAVPFNSPSRMELPRRFDVRGVPTLIILDSDGEIITANGRGYISGYGAAAFDAWDPEHSNESR